MPLGERPVLSPATSWRSNAASARRAEIRVATAQVRALIAALPRGRGTPAVRQHPARLAGISLRAGDQADTIVATATITRLGARFPFRFTLRKDHEQWRVVAAQVG